jgi:hypothetical protein
MNDQPSIEQLAQAEFDRFIQRMGLEHSRAQVFPVGKARLVDPAGCPGGHRRAGDRLQDLRRLAGAVFARPHHFH